MCRSGIVHPAKNLPRELGKMMGVVVAMGRKKAYNKTINALHKKPAEPAAPEAPTTKVCPYCQSEISIKAVRCPHCTSKLEGFPEINN